MQESEEERKVKIALGVIPGFLQEGGEADEKERDAPRSGVHNMQGRKKSTAETRLGGQAQRTQSRRGGDSKSGGIGGELGQHVDGERTAGVDASKRPTRRTNIQNDSPNRAACLLNSR